MKVIPGIQNLVQPLAHTVVTIGNFDGVHRGHTAIIKLAKEKARKINGRLVAYTFKPHPGAVLRPDLDLQFLTTYQERAELLTEAGADLVIEEPFSRAFSETGPEEFFNDVILQKLNTEVVVVGYDFGFGEGRQGHLNVLKELCEAAGAQMVVVPAQREGGEVISSTGIRRHLLAGEIESANALLGRPFFYRGIVQKGDRRGRKLGFPTANIKVEDKLVLPFGVYATEVVFQGKCYQGATSIGLRPTFADATPGILVETYLLDQDIDLYGEKLEIRFVKKLRDEKKFSGMDELRSQIQEDVKRVREFFA